MALEDSQSRQSVIPKSRPNFKHQGLSEVMADPESARAGSDSGRPFQLPCRESEAWDRLPFRAVPQVKSLQLLVIASPFGAPFVCLGLWL